MTRPLPYLDVLPLQRLWAQNELSVGREFDIGERRYLITGFDPVSVSPRRVYLQESSSDREYALVVDDED